MRITERRTARNKAIKGVFRSSIKKTKEAVSAGNSEEAKKWLEASIKSLDKAVQKKTIKKNTAARRKSRLNKMVKNLVTKK